MQNSTHHHMYHDVDVECANTKGTRLCFSIPLDLADVVKRNFAEGDTVILSTLTGSWGILYAVIHSLLKNKKHNEMLLLLSSQSESVITNNLLAINGVYRIDRFKSFDMNTTLVNNLVTFVSHKQAAVSLQSTLDTFFSQRGLSQNTNNTQMTFPSLHRLRDILIHNVPPSVSTSSTTMEQILQSIPLTAENRYLFQETIKMINDCNMDQLNSILLCFNSQDLCIIQGLPGTGKTQVITILILLLLLLNKRVLIASHTHTAIDNILLRLLPYSNFLIFFFDIDLPVLRLGDASKIHPSIRQYTFSQVWSGNFDEYIHIFNRSKVVGSTVYTSLSQFPRDFVFDVCIVDEAGQITEPSILQSLLLAKRSILVGDSKQLPPLVQSSLASDYGLSTSLIARLSEHYPKASFVCNLSIQYRMNQAIMGLANHLIYDNLLKTGSYEIANAKLDVRCTEQVPEWIQKSLHPDHSVVFINTDYCLSTMNKESTKTDSSWSRHNTFEISIVQLLVDALIDGGIQMKDIGIISPYAAQVMMLSNTLAYLK